MSNKSTGGGGGKRRTPGRRTPRANTGPKRYTKGTAALPGYLEKKKKR